MSDDIVARLRVLNHHAKKLAENESLHHLHRDAFTRCENLTWEAADEIDRLRGELFPIRKELEHMRAQRDGARAEVCLLRAARTETSDVVDQAMADYAVSRGWNDLFKEENAQIAENGGSEPYAADHARDALKEVAP